MRVAVRCIVLVSAVLLGVDAWAVEPLALYDDFNTPLLDPNKWFGVEEPTSILEVRREIVSSGRLLMENRGYGEKDTNSGRIRNTLSTRFTGGAAVTAIRATVRVDAFDVAGCPSNTEPTRAFARLSGEFFNTGAGNTGAGSGSAVDDVFAAIGLERATDSTDPPGVLQIIAFLRFCSDPTCLNGAVLSTSLGTVRLKRNVTLLIQWDPDNNRFIFQRDAFPPVFIGYAVADASRPNRPVQGLTVQHFVPNCDLSVNTTTPRPVAFMRAFFNDVFVNASAAP